MDENEKIMEDLEKPFEEKLAEQKAKDAAANSDELSKALPVANDSQAQQISTPQPELENLTTESVIDMHK